MKVSGEIVAMALNATAWHRSQVQPHLDGYGVRLEELVNPSIVWSDRDECEWSYQSERFRPVVDTDTETRVSIQNRQATAVIARSIDSHQNATARYA